MRPRGRLVCALVALAGAGLLLLAAGRPWVTAAPRDVPGVGHVAAAGSQAAAAVPALALVCVPAAAALLATGRLGRRLAAAVLALAGLAIVAVSVGVLSAPADAVAPAVAAATGRTGSAVPGASATGWVPVAVAAGLALACSGGYALLRARTWPAGGRRFERTTSGGAGTPRAHPDPGTAAGTAQAGDASRATDAIGAWDALSRGEDPTT